MIGFGVSVAGYTTSSIGSGGAVAPVVFYYLRPDTISRYRRPDGSLYIRP